MTKSQKTFAIPGLASAFTACALMLGVLPCASGARIAAQPEADYELRLADVQTLPQSTAGYLIFKTCASCETTSMTVAADTVYLIKQRVVSLSEFLEAAQSYRQTNIASANFAIFYDIASKHVNRVVLSPIER